jgi:hypothetical protein
MEGLSDAGEQRCGGTPAAIASEDHHDPPASRRHQIFVGRVGCSAG